MTIPPEYLVPFVVSNTLALVLLGVAWQWPRAARWLFVFVFGSAGAVNSFFAWNVPQSYVEAYGELALLAPYRDFINGFFSVHTTTIVQLIAAGQLAVAALLTRPGPMTILGGIGAIVFLIAITPLGIGSAFPCTLILAAAVTVMLVRRERSRTEAVLT